MKNKIIAHLSIILILSGVFCNVCNFYNRLSVYDRFNVYAEDNWTSVNSNDDLVEAFKYYCKSRNLVINGSGLDAVTSFTTSAFNKIVNKLGLDPTVLQAQLKKTTDGNLGLRYLFTQTGVSAYNRIFSEFLQNNDFDVGDDIDDYVVYSGEIYTDPNGNSCLVWNLPKANNHFDDSNPILWGSTYIYNGEGIKSLYNSGVQSLNLNYYNNGTLNSYSRGIYKINDFSVYKDIYALTNGTSSGSYISQYCHFILSDQTFNSDLIIFHVNGGTTFYFGNLVDLRSNTNSSYTSNIRWEYFFTFDNLGGVVDDAEISITTNNNVINNNEYNNNYVIIYRDGDTYISDDDDEPLPTTPPDGGGGGGGGDNPTYPDIPPVDPTPTPDPVVPNWNIELPEMPEGNDWLLYGLEKKFPWDIPFNLMYMLSLFAADPETPHFEGTLDLSVVQWNYDIDLAPFDDIARYFRNFEFIAFLLGLMLLTRRLIWG